jgi:hypothetical protein
MSEHEFLTVDMRRWCVNCDLFQKQRDKAWPQPMANCPRTTPHAKALDRGEKRKRGGPRSDIELLRTPIDHRYKIAP